MLDDTNTLVETLSGFCLPLLPYDTGFFIVAELAEVEKGEDTIHVYKDGYKIEYHGVRDPDTFVSWLMDVRPFLIIASD